MNVLTMGTFDLLHPGHLSLFGWCRRLAGPDGRVMATVNADAFVESYKCRRPVMDEEDRRRMVAAVREVDSCWVLPGREETPGVIELALRGGGVIVIGADWRDRDYLGQLGVTQGWLDERGIVVVYVPLVDGRSSTALRERMGS